MTGLLGINALCGGGGGARDPIWQTVFAQTLNANVFDGTYTYTNRQVISASLWQPSPAGTKMRITFESTPIGGLVFQEAFVGRQAASGDAYDFASTPTRITFSGGSNGFTLSAGQTILSDEITFAFDPSQNYVIAMDQGNSPGQGSPRALVTLAGASLYSKIADDAQTVDASGYTLQTSAALVAVKMIEVFG